MSESLSHEVHRHGIRVSVMLLGGVRTEALNKIDTELVGAQQDPRNGAIGSYSDGIKRLRRLITHAVQLAASREAVASKVAAAISSDNPAFRHLIGIDADIMSSVVGILLNASSMWMFRRIAGVGS